VKWMQNFVWKFQGKVRSDLGINRRTVSDWILGKLEAKLRSQLELVQVRASGGFLRALP
jgi:hypothetical protein